jgi:hypothetical protein
VNQTSWIVGTIILGFVVYITLQGQLPAYKSALFGSASTGNATATATAAQQTMTGSGASL